MVMDIHTPRPQINHRVYIQYRAKVWFIWFVLQLRGCLFVMRMHMTLTPVEHAFWLTGFVLWRKISAWHFAVLVEDKCSWDDPSVQVSVLSVQTSLLLLLHGDRMRLMAETQQAMR